MNKYMGCSLGQLRPQKLCVKPSRKPKRYKCEDHWGSQNHRENTKTRKPRFHDQWVAKTIEKTKQNKKTKIPGSMGSQNHRETKTTRFQDQWIAKAIEKTKAENKQTRSQDQ